MKHNRLIGIALCAIPTTAAAQYRQEQPPVIQPATQPPEPSDPDARIIAAFGERYHEAHEPNIALYWNRELTDAITGQTVNRTTTETSKYESVSPETGNHGGAKHEQSSSTTTATKETADDRPAQSLDPHSDSILRGAFVSTWRSVQAHLLDRTLIVRGHAAEQAQPIDTQLNEMQALKNAARYLMQVILVRDNHSPLGYGFKVTLEDLQNGAAIAEFYTIATPVRREYPGYIAVNGGSGFRRGTLPAPSIDEIGHTLAVEVMGQLNSSM